MDIRFYDLKLNLLRILPQNAPDCGYSSCVVTEELNGTGSFEISFNDDDLVRIVKGNPKPILARWNNVWGFIHSFYFKENPKKLIGMTMNGIFHRVVVQPRIFETAEISAILSYVLQQATSDWCTYENHTAFSDAIDYEIKQPTPLDEVLTDIMGYAGGGWKTGVKNGKINIVFIKPKDSPLIISESNLNAYNVSVTRNLKEQANVGWYKDESTDEWASVGIAKKGVLNSECVLESTTKAAAEKELAFKIGENDVTADTKGLVYGTDYELGDKVRVQDDGVTSVKQVVSVMLSQEATYTESPKLGDWADEDTG